MTMKNITRIFILSVGLWSCEDVDTFTPVPATSPSTFSAKFLLANGTVDAPSLDLYANNLKAGDGVLAGRFQDVNDTLASYNTIPITSNANIANTAIRLKASTGSIGGVLGANDLIYRASNTTSNNFTAANNAYYTLVAVDSIARPKPIRTLNTTKSNAGDITYFSYRSSFTAAKKVGVGDTTIFLNINSNNSTTKIDTVKLYNGGTLPPFIVPIGIVPLGSTDVGGIRFLALQDVSATFTTLSDSTTKAGFRVVNASPNAPTVRVRLEMTAGSGGNIDVQTPATTPVGTYPYILSYQSSTTAFGTFNPSVGSRTITGSTFSSSTIAPAGAPNTYTIKVATDAGFTNVLVSAPGYKFGGNSKKARNYTILITGLVGGTGDEALKISVIEHKLF